MSCSTCHDIHQPERAAAAYSDRCLSCHQVESCGMSKTMGHKISEAMACPIDRSNLTVDQLSAILCPMVFDMPQLSTWWQLRQRSEYAAAARSGWWMSWQVEQLMFGEDT